MSALRTACFALFLGATLDSAQVCADASDMPAGSVDVTVKSAPTPHRTVGIEWNSFPALALGKFSVTAVVVPRDHHALVLTPFFVSSTTAPIYVFDDEGNATQLPKQTFTGFGGELGYRYYFGLAGPRGLYLGPSLIVGAFNAAAQDGTHTGYGLFGLAGDVGYEALVADAVSLDLGAGLQFNWTDKAIPQQQFPANFYANRGLFPRVQLAVGWVF
jgi:hypothetical protein